MFNKEHKQNNISVKIFVHPILVQPTFSIIVILKQRDDLKLKPHCIYRVISNKHVINIITMHNNDNFRFSLIFYLYKPANLKVLTCSLLSLHNSNMNRYEQFNQTSVEKSEET